MSIDRRGNRASQSGTATPSGSEPRQREEDEPGDAASTDGTPPLDLGSAPDLRSQAVGAERDLRESQARAAQEAAEAREAEEAASAAATEAAKAEDHAQTEAAEAERAAQAADAAAEAQQVAWQTALDAAGDAAVAAHIAAEEAADIAEAEEQGAEAVAEAEESLAQTRIEIEALEALIASVEASPDLVEQLAEQAPWPINDICAIITHLDGPDALYALRANLKIKQIQANNEQQHVELAIQARDQRVATETQEAEQAAAEAEDAATAAEQAEAAAADAANAADAAATVAEEEAREATDASRQAEEARAAADAAAAHAATEAEQAEAAASEVEELRDEAVQAVAEATGEDPEDAAALVAEALGEEPPVSTERLDLRPTTGDETTADTPSLEGELEDLPVAEQDLSDSGDETADESTAIIAEAERTAPELVDSVADTSVAAEAESVEGETDEPAAATAPLVTAVQSEEAPPTDELTAPLESPQVVVDSIEESDVPPTGTIGVGDEGLRADLDRGVEDADGGELRTPEGIDPDGGIHDLIRRGEGLGYLGGEPGADLLPGDEVGPPDAGPGGIPDMDPGSLAEQEGLTPWTEGPDLASGATAGADPRQMAPGAGAAEMLGGVAASQARGGEFSDGLDGDALDEIGDAATKGMTPLQRANVKQQIGSTLTKEEEEAANAAAEEAAKKKEEEEAAKKKKEEEAAKKKEEEDKKKEEDGGEENDGNEESTPDSTPDPESGWTEAGVEVPPGPAPTPRDEPLDLVESMSQPVGDEADAAGEQPPFTLEEAMEGDVDPYAQWTDDHVDDDELAMSGSVVRPGSELLDPPKPALDDGVGDMAPSGGIEDLGTEDGQLDDEL